MVQFVINLLNIFPHRISTIIISAIPVFESRLAVPLSITYYNMHPSLAVLYSVIGGVLISYILLWSLGPFTGWLISRSKIMEKFFHWLFEHTRHRFIGKYEKYGLLALTIFVAAPLPGSGAWTGSLAAYVFGIEKKKAFIFIFIGVIIAAMALAYITVSAVWLKDYFLLN